jgi:hypothetical protein
MRPFPAEPMRMWPISTRVDKPENDDPSILDRVGHIGCVLAQLDRFMAEGIARLRLADQTQQKERPATEAVSDWS